MANNTKRGKLRSKLYLGVALIIVLSLGIAAAFFFFDRTEAVPPPPPLPTAASFPHAAPPLQSIKLFFFHPESVNLVDITWELRLSNDKIERIKQVITTLLEESPPTLVNTIPRGTQLNEVYLDENSTAYLDFTGALSATHMGGTTAELLTIQAILKTVQANFGNDIRYVQILIEGQEVDTITGHVDISKPLSLAASHQDKQVLSIDDEQ
ncbi:MAG: GerMN domain-containing protein [Candidatus Poribacteria bacterium]|nr:GerMN domain-containing protein [Candidatus Poribacteria bacterium]MDE0503741.1 GerMN domain-containing protein [Candidatus Poribacteria bacterium]